MDLNWFDLSKSRVLLVNSLVVREVWLLYMPCTHSLPIQRYVTEKANFRPNSAKHTTIYQQGCTKTVMQPALIAFGCQALNPQASDLNSFLRGGHKILIEGPVNFEVGFSRYIQDQWGLSSRPETQHRKHKYGTYRLLMLFSCKGSF